MIRLFVAALLVLASTQAFAEARPPGVPVPPVKYDKPFKGKQRVYIRTITEVGRMCQETGEPFEYVWACQWYGPKTCTIVLPRVDGHLVNHEGYNRLYRHERGHCNGWAGNHPGARYR